MKTAIILFSLLVLTAITATCIVSAQKQTPGHVVVILCDSIYGGGDYRIVLQRFPPDVGDTTDDNTVFQLFSKQEMIYTDTLHSFGGAPEFRDFNGDGVKDILIAGGRSARSNSFYHLYLIDPLRNEAVKIKGFDAIPNPRYLREYDLIESYALSGTNWTCFYEIRGDTIRDFGICIEDRVLYDDETVDAACDYDSEYGKAIEKILSIRATEK